MGSASAPSALLMVCLLILSTSEAGYTSCCHRYSSFKLPFSVISGLSIQTDREMCNINAIIFHTSRGKGCFDPSLSWVKDYVNRFRNKALSVHRRPTHR